MYYVSHRTAVRNKIKDMQITKRALYIWCAVLVLFLIGGTISFVLLSKKISEKRELERLEAAYEKAVAEEYSDLLFEYDRLVDIINDWNYSYDFRYKYAVQLNNLLGKTEYNTGYSWSTVDGSIEAIKETKDTYKDRLRTQAEINVYRRYIDED